MYQSGSHVSSVPQSVELGDHEAEDDMRSEKREQWREEKEDRREIANGFKLSMQKE